MPCRIKYVDKDKNGQITEREEIMSWEQIRYWRNYALHFSDHFTNVDIWDDLTAAQKGAFFAAIEICGRTITSVVDRRNKKVLKKLYEKGVITYDFSKKDRLAFRSAAVKIWNKWKKKSPEAKQLVELHIKYIQEIGLL